MSTEGHKIAIRSLDALTQNNWVETSYTEQTARRQAFNMLNMRECIDQATRDINKVKCRGSLGICIRQVNEG